MMRAPKPQKAFLRTHFFPLAILSLTLAPRVGAQSLRTFAPQLDASSLSAMTDYSSWCQDWQLECTGDLSQDESDEKASTVAWKALSSITMELFKSPSQFAVTRADLDAPQLILGLEKLKLDKVRVALCEHLDSLSWTKLTLAAQQLDLSFTESSSLASRQGLTFGLSPATQVQFTSPQHLEFKGFSLHSRDATQGGPLKSIDFTSPTTLSLHMSEQDISEVSSAYLAQSLLDALGFGDAVLSQTEKPDRSDLIRSFYPLMAWMSQPSRTLMLERSFFTSTADSLASLSAQNPAPLALLRGIESLRTLPQGSPTLVNVKQIAGGRLKCVSNGGELSLSFERDFGIKRFYMADQGGIGLEFFGLKAASNKAIGSFTIRRVEITPDAYVIRDVPLLGKITIPWDKAEQKPQDKESNIVCTS